MKDNNKEKVYDERGTKELRDTRLRGQKLVRKFNNCEPEDGQEQERIIGS